jgi:hypothetical protein
VKLSFFNNCVNWDRADVHAPGGLCDMIDGCRGITRKTFLRHVCANSRAEIERGLGYAPHDPRSPLTMKRDRHVTYHRAKLHGRTVYLFKHSAIEYVFSSP